MTILIYGNVFKYDYRLMNSFLNEPFKLETQWLLYTVGIKRNCTFKKIFTFINYSYFYLKYVSLTVFKLEKKNKKKKIRLHYIVKFVRALSLKGKKLSSVIVRIVTIVYNVQLLFMPTVCSMLCWSKENRNCSDSM